MHSSGVSPFSDLRRVADRLLDWRFHCWYWGDAIAIDGLMEAHGLSAGAYRDHVVDTMQRWHRSCLPNFDDALAPGAAIIRLVMDGDLPVQAGERVVARLEGLPRACGVVPALEPHRPSFRFGVCIDTVYHLPATYAQLARWTGEKRFAEKAIGVALDCMQVLCCKAGWAQWFDPIRKRNNAVAWSRGMGWALLGLLDLVHLLDGVGTGEVADLAGEVMERLAATQASDGNWPAVLDHPKADTETSTAAFFVAAALHPAADGLVALPRAVVERAIGACHRALSSDGTYTGVTEDVLPNWDITAYEHSPTGPSPWAQGAAVRAFAALARRAPSAGPG
ncbi:MAG TPA: glycoside hydrolase family 88 protein [Steroidobacteraceae bacterium]|nr:glycoside hydrolase family 88 protein [Steroidobacteraceae bacterium]